MDRLDPTYTNAVRYLYDRINYEKTVDRPYDQRSYRLARIEFFLKQLGSPHLVAPVIHVAGTKGKGSVSWLIAETLRRSGKSVGLYTSPHLLFLEERFVVNGHPCSPGELADHIEKLKVAAAATSETSLGQPTFFEMTTALAWSLFASHKTDVNVIEVGLGGRLDSTNVCQSSLAIITSISYDHQQQLGNTISLIAFEKAGIIKDKVPVISGATHPEAKHVIRERCRETQSELWELGTDFDVAIRPQHVLLDGQTASPKNIASYLDFSAKSHAFGNANFDNVSLGMLGKHQADNAAVAIAAWNRLNRDGWDLPKTALLDSLALTQLSCRIELVRDNPLTIIDTSHNVASIAALISALKDHLSPQKKTVIFGCSKDKEYEKMLDQVLEYADRLILTQFQTNPRAVPVERLEELATDRKDRFPEVEVLSAPSCSLAIEYASRSAVPHELICITGSFFLASEAKPLFPNTHRSDTFPN